MLVRAETTFCSHAPRAAFQSRAGVPAPPKPARVQVGRQFPRGSSARVLDEWARRRRCGACLWRSCTSGVECTAQLAVGTRCGSRGRCGKKGRARGVTHAGLREPASVLRCTWALVVQLLLHCCGASPSSPRTRARRARKQTSEQREDPKEWHGRWGAGRWAVEGRWQRCNDTFEARRPGGWGRKRSGHFT